jgi:ribosomal protein S19E (S16A)
MATQQQAIGETGRNSAMGIPWYRREDYPRIRKIMAEGERFPEAYDDWLHRAEAVERRIAVSGVPAIRQFAR